VRLTADSINGNAGLCKVVGENGSVGGLGTGPLDAVVVVVEPDSKVVVAFDLGGLAERLFNKSWALEMVSGIGTGW